MLEKEKVNDSVLTALVYLAERRKS